MPLIKPFPPLKNETQAQFALRFHGAFGNEIPETDEREVACRESWDRYSRDPLMDKAAKSFSQFRHVGGVPVFAEHETKDGSGKPVRYGRRDLAAIVDRCNSRISDTSDFAPITKGHTPDKDALDKGAEMPPVLGYAGPFRLGMIGNDNPRWAVFADEWHDPQHTDELRSMPRRSPEVWLEDRMEDRFFDPIAALGAETPRLDMGMTRYKLAARPDGSTVQKYSALPAATSVFVPSFGDDKDKQDYQAEGNSMLSPDDVKQVVDALMETEAMQWVQSQIGQETGGKEGVIPDDSADAGLPDDSGELLGDELSEDPADVPEVPAADELEPEPYSCDDEDTDMMARYMAGDLGDEEIAEYRRGKKKAVHYAAGGDIVDSEANADDATTVDGKEVNTGDGNVDNYSRRAAREIRAERAKYSKLERENKDLYSRLKKLEDDAEQSDREAELLQLAQEFAIDIDAERKQCSVAKMSRDAFNGHVGTIRKYAMQTGFGVPRLAVGQDEPKRGSVDRGARKTATEEQATQAQKYCMSQRQNGVEITYAEALEHVLSDEGKVAVTVTS